jgi:hypothetical protein
MENLIFYIIVQLNLVFGVAGLVWPDRLMPVFGVLMFPWPASHRAIRTHGIVAIVGYVLVLSKLLLISGKHTSTTKTSGWWSYTGAVLIASESFLIA